MRTTKEERNLIELLRHIKSGGSSLTQLIDMDQARKDFKALPLEDSHNNNHPVVKHHHNLCYLIKYLGKI
jgi:hypothetical protein